MKYFIVLILILILSFFYVILKDTAIDEQVIPKIEFSSEVDTSYFSMAHDKKYFKKIPINIHSKRKSLKNDSIVCFLEEFQFEDSISIEIPSKIRKKQLFIEFMSHTDSNEGNVTLKYNSRNKVIPIDKDLKNYRLSLGKLNTDLVIHKKNVDVLNIKLLESVTNKWNSKKKKSIIVFDIAGLNDSILADTLLVPTLSMIKSRSKYFSRTYLLSPDRRSSKLSFINCLDPHLQLDQDGYFNDEKEFIMDSLRVLSMLDIYDRSGYNTYYYGTEEDHLKLVDKFEKSVVFKDTSMVELDIVNEFFRDLISLKDEENFYYIDLNNRNSNSEVYLKFIDNILKELLYELQTKIAFKDHIFALISSSGNNFTDPYSSMFYSEGNIDAKEIEMSVKLNDISKTMLKYSNLLAPYYFSGNGMTDDEYIIDRLKIPGAFKDTLYFYDDEYLYKKVKYSKEFQLIDLKTKNNISEEANGVHEEYNEKLSKYYTGDIIKYLIFKNETEQPRTFDLKMSSSVRFTLIDEVKDYYFIKKNYGKHIKRINLTIDPLSKDTVKVFYRRADQKFDYKFGEILKIAYGPYSVNAGNIKEFKEESQFGDDKDLIDVEEAFTDYDLKIFNRRINY